MLRASIVTGLLIVGCLVIGCNPAVESSDPVSTASATADSTDSATAANTAQDSATNTDQSPDSPTSPPQTYDEARVRTKATPGDRKLRKIGLAMHGYHDIFGRFPPAVLMGPDGKTPYSWRVELLPSLKYYVEQIKPDPFSGKTDREAYWKLIEDCGYDLSQPWDSPANQEMLKEATDVYRHPADEHDSFASGFYAVVGEGTAFDPTEVSSYDDIAGWPASTLMIAEARRDEPWTKPVDIEITETVPQLGGFTESGFLVLTADGCVHFVPSNVPPADLRALITKSDSDSFEIMGIPFRY